MYAHLPILHLSKDKLSTEKKLQYGNTEKLVLWLCEKESELRVINFTKNRNSLLSRTHTQIRREQSDIVSGKRARATMIYLTLSLWFIYRSLTCCCVCMSNAVFSMLRKKQRNSYFDAAIFVFAIKAIKFAKHLYNI